MQIAWRRKEWTGEGLGVSIGKEERDAPGHNGASHVANTDAADSVDLWVDSCRLFSLYNSQRTPLQHLPTIPCCMRRCILTPTTPA